MTTPKLSPSAVAQGRIRAMNNWLEARVNVNPGDTLEENGHGRREREREMPGIVGGRRGSS